MELEKNEINVGLEREVQESELTKRDEEGKGRKGGRVRRANFDDLEAIMEINDEVYDSLDYMPALFYTFMHSKLHVIYVYEEDDKLVSLSNFRFYRDCDDLVTWMSIRVRSSHQGRGYGSSESSPLIRQLLKEHPNIRRYVLDTLYTRNIEAKLHKWELLSHWNVLVYKITERQRLSRSIPISQMALGSPRPFTLSYTTATEWLEHSDQLVRFISRYAKDFIPTSATWMPLPISRSGLRELFLAANVTVSLGLAETSSAPDKSSSTDLKPKIELIRIRNIASMGVGGNGVTADELVGLSYSTASQCKYGATIDFYFYGDCENVLLNHLYNHLLHYVSVTLDDVRLGVNINFPLAVNQKIVEERVKEVLGNKVISDYYCVTQAVQYIAQLPTVTS